MKRPLLIVAGLLVLGTDALRGQIIRPVRRFTPIAWTSLSVGWLQQQGIYDPGTNAAWHFGSGPQFRASLGIPVGTGATLGVVGSMARLPLIYAGALLGDRSCLNCDADATVSQVLANFRIGGGSGFHQVIDLNAGYTSFHNFRRSDDGAALGSESPVNDFTFGLGYGFGYTFSERAQLVIVQDVALLIHKRQSGSAESTVQQRVTRVGGRFALGNRN
ncbi:MAG: hypothetical protein WD801_15040 [Gemmatimonadaceae bacterium]